MKKDKMVDGGKFFFLSDFLGLDGCMELLFFLFFFD